MLGLYAIAFLAPLAVFGCFAAIIQRHGNRMFEDRNKAMTLFVVAPLAFCYGVITLVAAAYFISYLYGQ